MIMKKALLAALISVAIPNVVLAADLYTKAPPPAGFDWSGLYIGGHIGGGWATNDFTNFGDGPAGFGGPGNATLVTQTTKSSGFLGGIQAGANYQIGRLVLGTEFDFSWSGINGTNTADYADFIGDPLHKSQTLSADTNWIGTATTRLGVVRGNWMLYSKAGVAWVNTNYTQNNTHFTNSFDIFDGTGSTTEVGWTVGTGLEWAFLNNWTAKLEYDFIDVGNNATTINGTRDPGRFFQSPLSFTTNNLQTISEVKFGLNYKFDPGWLLFW
jgi:outer membrane immunogenic protein